MSASGNKKIAKNTLFLYFRMLFTMLVSLYTSRVVLQYLGVEDYGTYQTVGGIVGMLSFLNGVLNTGTSRFLTFELGRGDKDKLHRTFCTSLNLHVGMALIVVMAAETVGLWFFYNKLGIPQDRVDVAFWVYQLSIVTSVISITQVPYGASIISHEKMDLYAYVSIVEVVLKLLIVYMLTITPYDRLIVYAVLLFIVQCGIAMFYRYYCVRHFEETRYQLVHDKAVLKDIFGFSGWTVITHASIALNNQGFIILTNMFFGPAVVTARAIALQVNMAANQFVNNFRTAVNPQVVKRYAAGDVEGSNHLVLSSTLYSFFLMYLLSLPILLLAEPLLKLWLGNVPEYSVIFLQIVIVESLFCVFDTGFYTALYAKGRLKENAIISPSIGFILFPIVYILFKNGYSPVVLSWLSLAKYMLLGLVIKPVLLHKVANFKYSQFLPIFARCLLVVIVSSPIVALVDKYLFADMPNFVHLVCTSAFSIVISGICIYYLGLDKSTRLRITHFVINRVRKCAIK